MTIGDAVAQRSCHARRSLSPPFNARTSAPSLGIRVGRDATPGLSRDGRRRPISPGLRSKSMRANRGVPRRRVAAATEASNEERLIDHLSRRLSGRFDGIWLGGRPASKHGSCPMNRLSRASVPAVRRPVGRQSGKGAINSFDFGSAAERVGTVRRMRSRLRRSSLPSSTLRCPLIDAPVARIRAPPAIPSPAHCLGVSDRSAVATRRGADRSAASERIAVGWPRRSRCTAKPGRSLCQPPPNPLIGKGGESRRKPLLRHRPSSL